MILTWQMLETQTFVEAKKKLCHAAKRVGDVTLRDLVVLGEHQNRQNNGVYFFWKEDRPVYIGSAGSRSFVERVPAHFDPRPDAWFATLIKRLREKPLIAGKDPHEQAFALRLSLLPCARNSNAPDPLDLESFFIASMGTWLNRSRWVYVPHAGRSLKDELMAWRERRRRREADTSS